MEFYRKKLGNGLTVLFEKRNLPVVSVSASVKWGSEFENEKNKGVSHFIEHLMFKGTLTRSQEEIAREIEKKGGILNAFTSEEITSYWCKIPSRHFDSGMNISSDLILNPKIDAVEFEKEKNVIIEEIKMYHDNPRMYVLGKIKELLYKKPFGMSVAGKSEIIRGITRKQVLELIKEKYSSDSMILTVVGKADFQDICERAGKLFPATKREKQESRIVKINSEELEKRDGIDQTHMIMGFHSPALNDFKRYAYELAGCYLFDGMSSRLFQEVREKRGLAYSIQGDFDLGKNYGYCYIYAGTKKEKINEIKEIIIKEIKNLKKITLKELEECKEQLIGMREIEEEDSVNAMNSIMIEESAGNSEEYYKYNERIRKIKLEDVRNLSKISNFSSFALVPK